MHANHTGRTAENLIADVLMRRHCEFRRQVTIGRSIYQTALRADFVIDNLIEFPDGLVIESKWQDADGTADEKFPYLVRNIQDGCYGRPVVVIVAGGGCRSGAEQWLREQVDGNLYAVFNFEELVSWLHRSVNVQIRAPRLLM